VPKGKQGWQKGQSGNPAGRPKDPERKKLRDMAREHTQAALQTIIDVMTDPTAKPGIRLKAADILLDRGWGKAAPIVEDVAKEAEKVTVLLDIAPPEILEPLEPEPK
jgi:hypothetical protein